MCSQTELRAAGLIIYRQLSASIEYLLLQTSYGIHHWTPPKGHVDPGESDLDTALRETKEESGLSLHHDFVVNENFKRELKYVVNEKPKTVVYWLAHLTNPSARIQLSHEHQDFRWLPLSAAKTLAGYDDMQQLLQDCEDFLEGGQS